MDYIFNNVIRAFLYFLADVIYPNDAVFVKNIANGGKTPKDKKFVRAQETVMKDVERPFGILIPRLHVPERSIQLWYNADIELLGRACVLLHNMVVEARRGYYSSGMCGLFSWMSLLPSRCTPIICFAVRMILCQVPAECSAI